MGAATPPPRRARTGRPRADGTSPDRPPREEIILAASRLFAERGVGATTMSEIARGAGLRQSSVYYYFKDKESILEQIASSANTVILESFARIEQTGGSPATRLYRFVVADVMQLCSFPFDINEIYRLTALQEPRFAGFWAERDEINRAVEGLIAEGITLGELATDDPQLAALVLTSTDEGIQNWFRPVGGPFSGGGAPYPSDRIAIFVADLVVGGLLVDRGRLAALREIALSE